MITVRFSNDMPGRTSVVVGVSLLGTAEPKDEPPARTFQERLKRCYELAGYALLFGDVPEGTLLVHGTIHGPKEDQQRIGHAWLRLPDGTIWEPITGDIHASWITWRDFANAKVERTYTEGEARRLVLMDGTWGRWHDSRYP